MNLFQNNQFYQIWDVLLIPIVKNGITWFIIFGLDSIIAIYGENNYSFVLMTLIGMGFYLIFTVLLIVKIMKSTDGKIVNNFSGTDDQDKERPSKLIFFMNRL